MGYWRTEYGQDCIADEFFDEAIIAANLPGQGLEAPHHEASELLRIELFG